MEFAVRCQGVSKRYRIGERRDARNFREVLRDAFRSPFRSSAARADAEPPAEVWALNDVSFDVRHGEAIGFIGENGAGKSTLLKILSRITEPTSGRIEVRGRVSSLLEVGTGFHGELTGRENIQLNGAILGMTRREIRERFDQIVAFAEIDRFIDTPVKYYSSGMYMRLAFAVAAHLEPEILIVDEVLAVGDASFQNKCLRKMSDVAHEGRTVLFVSHNMPAVKALCNRAVWLKQGRIIDRGTPTAVVSHYLQHVTSDDAREDLAEVIASSEHDPVFRLTSIRTLQKDTDTRHVFNGEETKVEIGFEVFESTLGLQVYFQLYDLEEVLIFESLHNGAAPPPPIVPPGRYLATATIPANLLASRPYQLRIKAGIHNVRHLINPIRVNIDVHESGVVNRAFGGYESPGRIAPLLSWTVERTE
ncbi:MAG: ABC transporter ATP-binding protein [Thermoanaerobaculia bacterium]